MNSKSVIEYLERHINGHLHDHQYMPQFISYEQMKKNINDEFTISKIYNEFKMIELIKYILNSINKENIIEKNNYQSFAEKIYDEFYNQKNQ